MDLLMVGRMLSMLFRHLPHGEIQGDEAVEDLYLLQGSRLVLGVGDRRYVLLGVRAGPFGERFPDPEDEAPGVQRWREMPDGGFEVVVFRGRQQLGRGLLGRNTGVASPWN